MTAVKTPNYSTAQEALIVAAIAVNDGVANKSVAEMLSADSRMNGENGVRTPRAIIAKMVRMNVNYQRQEKLTKSGEPVTKKTDLVNKIAKLADVSAAKLDGLDKAPKLALETLAAAFAA